MIENFKSLGFKDMHPMQVEAIDGACSGLP
jgi:hypothetical protein